MCGPKFKLSSRGNIACSTRWTWSPITDANLGFSNYPVRIVEVEEDDKGLLAITAEELVVGVSTPAFYQNASPAGSFQQDTGAPA